MKTVKFNTEGKWAEVDPREPQFEVEADDERVVSDGLAEIIVGAGRGEIIADAVVEVEEEKVEAPTDETSTDNVLKTGKEDPAKDDKTKSQKNPSKKDKKNAESK